MSLETICPKCGNKFSVDSKLIEYLENDHEWFANEMERKMDDFNKSTEFIFSSLRKIMDYFKANKSTSKDKSLEIELSFFKNKNRLTNSQLKEILNISSKTEEAYLPLMYLLSEIKTGNNLWRGSDLITLFYIKIERELGKKQNKPIKKIDDGIRKKLERATMRYLTNFYENENTGISIFSIKKVQKKVKGILRIEYNYKIDKLSDLGVQLKGILEKSEKVKELVNNNKLEDALILLENSFDEINR